MFICQKKICQMDKSCGDSGAVIYSDRKKHFMSTVASHKAHRPKEELIAFEDNIIWFKQ